MKKKLSVIALLFVLLLTFAMAPIAQATETPSLSSTVYNIDNTDLIVRGVGKNTSVETFLVNIGNPAGATVTRNGTNVEDDVKTGDILTVSETAYTIKTDLVEDVSYKNYTFDTSKGTWGTGGGAISLAEETVDGVTRKFAKIDLTNGNKAQSDITTMPQTAKMLVTEFEAAFPTTAEYTNKLHFQTQYNNTSGYYFGVLRRVNNAGTKIKAMSTNYSNETNITLGEWHSYKMLIDYTTGTFRILVDGDEPFKYGGTNNMPYQAYAKSTTSRTNRFHLEWSTSTKEAYLKLDNLKMYEPKPAVVSKLTFTTGDDVCVNVNEVYNTVGNIAVKFAMSDGNALDEATLSNVKLYDGETEVAVENRSYTASTMTYTFKPAQNLEIGKRYTIKFDGVKDARGLGIEETAGFNTVATPAPAYSISSTVYTVADSKISGVEAGTTKAQLLANLEITGATAFVVKDVQGGELSDADVLKDGTTLTLKDTFNATVYNVELDYETNPLIKIDRAEFIANEEVVTTIYKNLTSVKVYFDVSDLTSIVENSFENNVSIYKTADSESNVEIENGIYDAVNKVYTFDIKGELASETNYTIKFENIKDVFFGYEYTATETFDVAQTPDASYTISSEVYTVADLKIKGVIPGTTVEQLLANLTITGATPVIEDSEGNAITSGILKEGTTLTLSDRYNTSKYEVVLDFSDELIKVAGYEFLAGEISDEKAYSDLTSVKVNFNVSDLTSIDAESFNNINVYKAGTEVTVTISNAKFENNTYTFNIDGSALTVGESYTIKFKNIKDTVFGKEYDFEKTFVINENEAPSYSVLSTAYTVDGLKITGVKPITTKAQLLANLTITEGFTPVVKDSEGTEIADDSAILKDGTTLTLSDRFNTSVYVVELDYVKYPLIKSTKFEFITDDESNLNADAVYDRLDSIKVYFDVLDGTAIDADSFNNVSVHKKDDPSQIVSISDGVYNAEEKAYTFNINEQLEVGGNYTVDFANVKDTIFGKDHVFAKDFSVIKMPLKHEIKSEEYNINKGALKISGVRSETTIEEFIANLEIELVEVKEIRNQNDEVVTSGVIENGYKLVLTDNVEDLVYTISVSQAQYDYLVNENFDESTGTWSVEDVVSLKEEPYADTTRKYLSIDLTSSAATSTYMTVPNRTNAEIAIVEFDAFIPDTSVYTQRAYFQTRYHATNGGTFFAAFRRNDNDGAKITALGTPNSTGTITPGGWHHYKMITNYGTGKFDVYVDGKLTLKDIAYQATGNNRIKYFQLEWKKSSKPAEIKLDNLRIYEPKSVAVSKATFITSDVVSTALDKVYNRVTQIKVQFNAEDGALIDSATLSNTKLYDSSSAVIPTSFESYDESTMTYTFNVLQDLNIGEKYTIKFKGVTDTKYGVSASGTIEFTTIETPAPTFEISSEVYGVNNETLEITGVAAGTTKAQLLSNLAISGTTAVVKDENGNEIGDADALIEGSVVILKDQYNISKYVVKLYFDPPLITDSKYEFTTGDTTSSNPAEFYDLVKNIKVYFDVLEGTTIDAATANKVGLYDSEGNAVAIKNASYDSENRVYSFDVNAKLTAGANYTVKVEDIKDIFYKKSYTFEKTFTVIATPAPTYEVSSEVYTVNNETFAITGVTAGTTKKELLEKLVITGTTPVVKDSKGNEMADADLIKDGVTITLKDALNTSVYTVSLDFSEDLIKAEKFEFITGEYVSENTVYTKLTSVKVYFNVAAGTSIDASSIKDVTIHDETFDEFVTVLNGSYDAENKVYSFDIGSTLKVGKSYTLEIKNVKEKAHGKTYTFYKTLEVVATPAPTFAISSEVYAVNNETLKITGVVPGTTKSDFISKLTFVGDYVVKDAKGNEMADADLVKDGTTITLKDTYNTSVYNVELDYSDALIKSDKYEFITGEYVLDGLTPVYNTIKTVKVYFAVSDVTSIDETSLKNIALYDAQDNAVAIKNGSYDAENKVYTFDIDATLTVGASYKVVVKNVKETVFGKTYSFEKTFTTKGTPALVYELDVSEYALNEMQIENVDEETLVGEFLSKVSVAGEGVSIKAVTDADGNVVANDVLVKTGYKLVITNTFQDAFYTIVTNAIESSFLVNYTFDNEAGTWATGAGAVSLKEETVEGVTRKYLSVDLTKGKELKLNLSQSSSAKMAIVEFDAMFPTTTEYSKKLYINTKYSDGKWTNESGKEYSQFFAIIRRDSGSNFKAMSTAFSNNAEIKLGQWHNYKIILNYETGTYRVIVDGKEPFKYGGTNNMPYQAQLDKRIKLFQIEWDQVSTPAEIKLDNLKIYEPKAAVAKKATFVIDENEITDSSNVYNRIDKIKVKFAGAEGNNIDANTLSNVKLYDGGTEIAIKNGSYDAATMTYSFNISDTLEVGKHYTIKFDGVKDINGIAVEGTLEFNTIATPGKSYEITSGVYQISENEITGVAAGTTKAQLLANLAITGGPVITLTDKAGNEIADNAIVKEESILKLSDGINDAFYVVKLDFANILFKVAKYEFITESGFVSEDVVYSNSTSVKVYFDVLDSADIDVASLESINVYDSENKALTLVNRSYDAENKVYSFVINEKLTAGKAYTVSLKAVSDVDYGKAYQEYEKTFTVSEIPSAEYSITSSVYTIANNEITGVVPYTTKEELMNNLQISGTYVVKYADGSDIADSDTLDDGVTITLSGTYSVAVYTVKLDFTNNPLVKVKKYQFITGDDVNENADTVYNTMDTVKVHFSILDRTIIDEAVFNNINIYDSVNNPLTIANRSYDAVSNVYTFKVNEGQLVAGATYTLKVENIKDEFYGKTYSTEQALKVIWTPFEHEVLTNKYNVNKRETTILGVLEGTEKATFLSNITVTGDGVTVEGIRDKGGVAVTADNAVIKEGYTLVLTKVVGESDIREVLYTIETDALADNYYYLKNDFESSIGSWSDGSETLSLVERADGEGKCLQVDFTVTGEKRIATAAVTNRPNAEVFVTEFDMFIPTSDVYSKKLYLATKCATGGSDTFATLRRASGGEDKIYALSSGNTNSLSIKLGEWHHYKMITNYQTKTFQIFVDGSLLEFKIASKLDLPYQATTGKRLKFLEIEWDVVSNPNAKMFIDNLKIYEPNFVEVSKLTFETNGTESVNISSVSNLAEKIDIHLSESDEVTFIDMDKNPSSSVKVYDSEGNEVESTGKYVDGKYSLSLNENLKQNETYTVKIDSISYEPYKSTYSKELKFTAKGADVNVTGGTVSVGTNNAALNATIKNTTSETKKVNVIAVFVDADGKIIATKSKTSSLSAGEILNSDFIADTLKASQVKSVRVYVEEDGGAPIAETYVVNK